MLEGLDETPIKLDALSICRAVYSVGLLVSLVELAHYLLGHRARQQRVSNPIATELQGLETPRVLVEFQQLPNLDQQVYDLALRFNRLGQFVVELVDDVSSHTD